MTVVLGLVFFTTVLRDWLGRTTTEGPKWLILCQAECETLTESKLMLCGVWLVPQPSGPAQSSSKPQSLTSDKLTSPAVGHWGTCPPPTSNNLFFLLHFGATKCDSNLFKTLLTRAIKNSSFFHFFLRKKGTGFLVTRRTFISCYSMCLI